MTTVKVGERRKHNQGDQKEFRVIAISDDLAWCTDGSTPGIGYLAEHSTVLPPRDGEYVEGEMVEVYKGAGEWVSATYLLESNGWYFCCPLKSRPQAYVASEVRRPPSNPKPKTGVDVE